MRIKIKNGVKYGRFKLLTPDRVLGTKDQLTELGMRPTAPPSDTSVMWTYEETPILIPLGQVFDVDFKVADDEEYGDLHFENGVIFGYVDAKLEDWTVVE